MKLRNKKTGEIKELTIFAEKFYLEDIDFAQGESIEYGSLAKLSKEWEDYEEPKEYWCIRENGVVDKRPYPIVIESAEQENRKAMQEIGNYFETEEEAERAVEKLKAWKRLKDKGFRFGHWVTERDKKCGKVEFKCDDIGLSFDKAHEFFNDITLIFWSEK